MAQMEECSEGSPPTMSHLCGVSVLNASVLSETICGVCCLEVGNQRLTLNLNIHIVMYFHGVFKFHEFTNKYKKIIADSGMWT
jgi:hypothetical protein